MTSLELPQSERPLARFIVFKRWLQAPLSPGSPVAQRVNVCCIRPERCHGIDFAGRGGRVAALALAWIDRLTGKPDGKTRGVQG